MISDPAPCTVERKCSSAGKACDAEDRGCQSDAIARGLEITCERAEPRSYVYCPPGAEPRDSSVVWILLAVALAIAAFGSIGAYFLFRKRR
ncbi:MAG TPA: hypothetical protein VM925_05050 [Labilithrix sp.]|jgi:hypothetical protein|nr:hypothetical protein [Labilithrix sp.]